MPRLQFTEIQDEDGCSSTDRGPYPVRDGQTKVFYYILGFILLYLQSTQISVDSVEYLRTGGRWFPPQTRLIFFARIGYSPCDSIHFSFTAGHCFDDSNVGKQLVALEEYCA